MKHIRKFIQLRKLIFLNLSFSSWHKALEGISALEDLSLNDLPLAAASFNQPTHENVPTISIPVYKLTLFIRKG